MDFDLNSLILEFINPPQEPILKKVFKKRADQKQELIEKAQRAQSVKDLTKMYAWREILRPKIMNDLKSGMGKLIRDGLTMSEVDIKAEIAKMRNSISSIADLRYVVDEGNEAAKTLEKME